jgi:hypothetical protein
MLGCATLPDRHDPSPYKDLTVALMLSENSKNAAQYLKTINALAFFNPIAQFSVEKLFQDTTDIFQRNFRATARIEKIDDAKNVNADLVAILDIVAESGVVSFTRTKFEITAILLTLDQKQVAVVKGEGVRIIPFPAFSTMIQGAASEAQNNFETALLSSEPLRAFSKSGPGASTAVAVRPQVTPFPTTSTIPSDIDKPVFDAATKIMGDNDVAVVIGVEKYQDLPASEFAANDALLVKEYLTSLGMKERNIEVLLNERATGTAFRKALESWLPNHVKKDSRLFIYYAGHGAPDPATGEAYLVPYDADPNYLSTTGHPLKVLYEKLGALPASEVMVMLDACFSGAGGRSVLAKGARPLVVVKDKMGMAPNMAVLMATQGTQISTSSPDKGHGILTYYFLKAIKDGKKDLAEIYSFIKPQVEDEAKLLNVSQTPSLTPDPAALQGKFRLRK